MLVIGDKQFDVLIERKHIRNIYLKVEGTKIFVSCPYYISSFEIDNFINEKRKWIYKASNKKEVNSKLSVGETIYYRGKLYKLVVLNGNKNIKIDDTTIYIRCRSADIEGALKVFYEYGKRVIKDYVLENQEKYLDILKDYGYNKEPIYNVKYLKSMWGCCYSKKNTINLSVRLIHFEDRCIEAILWHELLHFIIPNHSKRYHQVIESYMRDYNEIVKTLH